MGKEGERPLGIKFEFVTDSEPVEGEIDRAVGEGMTLEEIGTQAITHWAMERRIEREKENSKEGSSRTKNVTVINLRPATIGGGSRGGGI